MELRLDLDDELVQHVYSAESLRVDAGCSVRDVLRLMKERDRGCALVCRDGKLDGIFTERDALRLMATAQDLDQSIEAVMAASPVSVRLGDTVAQAIRKMSEGGYRRLPVVNDDGEPLGVLKASGILHFFVEHLRNVVYTLPPQPHQVMQEREGA
ncbi:MAG: CBS domain-containing protein [Planctomycetes bacterium]|nr:CBS domain-containing protein [Planctomycetota bacterium]